MAYHHPIQNPSSALHFLNSPFGDTTFTKVFVGGLAWETQSETLRRHFQQYGEILEAVVISDRNTGRSKGYGFVTFRDPESAGRACTETSPIIDGRWTNCNLASLGRPRPAISFAQLRAPGPYFGTVPIPREAYAGSSTFNRTVPYGYHQGIPYAPFGYTAYGPESVYPQNVYNPYVGQQYAQVYGVPGTTNTVEYPYGQFGPPVLAGAGHSYTTAAVPSYTVPGHHFVRLSGPNINGVTASPCPSNQTPFPPGEALTNERTSHMQKPPILIRRDGRVRSVRERDYQEMIMRFRNVSSVIIRGGSVSRSILQLQFLLLVISLFQHNRHNSLLVVVQTKQWVEKSSMVKNMLRSSLVMVTGDNRRVSAWSLAPVDGAVPLEEHESS